ncbi:hypothetical protein KEM54_006056 [Ascosphaera aggregata]|nr:hypothetical protein KEM54_006056 [Ascosphaera aggregata]
MHFALQVENVSDFKDVSLKLEYVMTVEGPLRPVQYFGYEPNHTPAVIHQLIRHHDRDLPTSQISTAMLAETLSYPGVVKSDGQSATLQRTRRRFSCIHQQTRPPYSARELLAIIRASRYNELFVTVSFAGVSLISLGGTYDILGDGKDARTIRDDDSTLNRVDFTRSISRGPNQRRVESCWFFQATFPLCKREYTKSNWATLTGIKLGTVDLDLIVNAASSEVLRIRVLEVCCGLPSYDSDLITTITLAQEDTLEVLDLSGALDQFTSGTSQSALANRKYVRKLVVSNITFFATSRCWFRDLLSTAWFLDIFGGSGHLNFAYFGIGLHDALDTLMKNHTLEILKIERQRIILSRTSQPIGPSIKFNRFSSTSNDWVKSQSKLPVTLPVVWRYPPTKTSSSLRCLTPQSSTTTLSRFSDTTNAPPNKAGADPITAFEEEELDAAINRLKPYLQYQYELAILMLIPTNISHCSDHRVGSTGTSGSSTRARSHPTSVKGWTIKKFSSRRTLASLKEF